MKLEELFDKANQEITSGNTDKFVMLIREFYDELTCNCFLNEQDDLVFQSQLEIIERLNSREENFNVNLLKGYVYLQNDYEEEAFKQLSDVIESNNKDDLAYSLRAIIKEDINPHFIEDARMAVILNPTPRNYFVLGNALGTDSNETENAIICFGKAISLNPQFACAYNNRAHLYIEQNNYELAITDFKKCIEIEPNHWAYYQLWKCLDKTKNYDDALYFAQKGAEIHPDIISYQFSLGLAYARIKEYEKSIEHNSIYLKHFPDDKAARINIVLCRKLILDQKISNARRYFENCDFSSSISEFESCLKPDIVLDDEDIKCYLLSLLKDKKPNIQLDEKNPLFILLSRLKESCFLKKKNGLELSKNEEGVNKLMKYELDYTIGFGEYKGNSIREILEKDAHYILWCIVNLIHFSVDNLALANPILKQDSLFIAAIEFNLVKSMALAKWKPIVESESRFNKDKTHNYYRSDYDSPYYNDALDMDQQSPEFWDSL